METQKLKDKIQKLINYSTKLGERSKNLSKLLYQQLEEVNELETLEKIEGKFLMAYLIWKSIKRANYQVKHTQLTNFKEDGKEKLLELIEKEVELIETKNQTQISDELTTEELWKQLELRLKSGEITRSDFVDKGKELLIIFRKEHE